MGDRELEREEPKRKVKIERERERCRNGKKEKLNEFVRRESIARERERERNKRKNERMGRMRGGGEKKLKGKKEKRKMITSFLMDLMRSISLGSIRRSLKLLRRGNILDKPISSCL